MTIQKSIRVNSWEEEEEQGCMEVYKCKTEEGAEDAKNRGASQIK